MASTKLAVHLACRLEDEDRPTSRGGLQLKVYSKSDNGSTWRELDTGPLSQPLPRGVEGVAEVSATIEVEYIFHAPKQLRVVVTQSRSSDGGVGKGAKRSHIVGESQVDLPALLTARDMHLSLPLTQERTEKESVGTLEAKGEEVTNIRDVLCLYMRARGLPKAGDAALAISASVAGGWQQVARTEFVFGTVLGTTEPIWRPLQVPVKRLCKGPNDDKGEALRLDCLLNSSFTGPYSIGHCQVATSEFLQATKDTPFKLSDGGSVHLLHSRLVRRFSFLDYVSGGCEISVMVAIDFTASNGDPEKKSSLHYVRGGPNEYELAIRAVAEPLSHYCTSKRILAFGYGAEVQHSGVSHCFSLTFDDQHPEARGVDGLLECYKGALKKVRLRGPTHFAQIIERAANSVALANENSASAQSHMVLLIITDGIINDMEETVLQIEEAGLLPLSILIVGVGDADFTNMDILCQDHKHVKFVSMAEYKEGPLSDLSAALLKDIPQQCVEHMHENEIQPLRLPVSSLPLFLGMKHQRVTRTDERVDEDEEEDMPRTEPPAWQPDDTAIHCERCHAEFTLLWRRHHCRYCGGIFCDTCSQYTARLPFSPDPTPQRVCDECYATLVQIHFPCN